MKKILIINFLIFSILINLVSTSYASGIVLPDDDFTNTRTNITNTNTSTTGITITEDALQNSLNEMVKELAKNTSENDSPSSIVTDMKIDSANKKILVTTQDGNTCDLSYNLSGKPTFSHEVLVKEGMSYDEYNKTANNIGTFVWYTYIASIKTTGVSFDDIFSYFNKIILTTLFSAFSNINNSSLTALPNFEDGVIKYFDAQFPQNSQTFSDKEFLDTFTLTSKKENSTETSRKLKYTITLNPDTDFSKLNGYAEKFENNPIGDITKENANYVLTLKVGQNYKLETTKKINGFSFDAQNVIGNGTGLSIINGYIEIDFDNTEIIANEAGKTGIYIRMEDKFKSFYIISEENNAGISAEPIILKITDDSVIENLPPTNTTPSTSTPTPPVSDAIQQQKNTISKPNNTPINLNKIEKLPQTGRSFGLIDGLYTLCILSSITLLAIVIKYRKI